MASTAIGWDLYQRTHSPMVLGWVGLAQFLPVALFALPAGVVADRYDRKRVLLATLVVQAIAYLALAFLGSAGAPLWSVYGCLFFAGTARAFHAPARSALLPMIAPRDELARIVNLSTACFQVASLAGPALAGGLLAVLPRVSGLYAGVAVCLALFAAVLVTVPVPREPVVVHRALDLHEVGAGIRFLWSEEILRSAIALDTVAVLLGGVTALMPVFAQERLHVGPEILGWLVAAPSLGATATSLWLARRPPIRHNGPALLASVGAYGLATLAFACTTHVALAAVCLVVVGATDMVSVVVRSQLVTMLTPDALRGRVEAVHRLFISTSNELGSFESGLTAAWWGAVPAVVVGALGTLGTVGLITGGSRRRRELREIERVPA
jgi:MFS family permease